MGKIRHFRVMITGTHLCDGWHTFRNRLNEVIEAPNPFEAGDKGRLIFFERFANDMQDHVGWDIIEEVEVLN